MSYPPIESSLAESNHMEPSGATNTDHSSPPVLRKLRFSGDDHFPSIDSDLQISLPPIGSFPLKVPPDVKYAIVSSEFTQMSHSFTSVLSSVIRVPSVQPPFSSSNTDLKKS